MDDLARKLDEGLGRWKPKTGATVRAALSRLIEQADLGCFDFEPRPPLDVEVAIIGVDHSLQWTQEDENNGDLRRYREIVSREIASCVAVLEEAAEHENRSFAKQIAGESSVRYVNIDIPQAIQTQVHHQGLQGKPGDDTDPLDDLYARAWNLVREHHMREEVHREVTRVRCGSGGKILVICGLFHIDAIRRYLRDEATVMYLEVFKPPA